MAVGALLSVMGGAMEVVIPICNLIRGRCSPVNILPKEMSKGIKEIGLANVILDADEIYSESFGISVVYLRATVQSVS